MKISASNADLDSNEDNSKRLNKAIYTIVTYTEVYPVSSQSFLLLQNFMILRYI
jgi:hypothetical protein